MEVLKGSAKINYPDLVKRAIGDTSYEALDYAWALGASFLFIIRVAGGKSYCQAPPSPIARLYCPHANTLAKS